MTYRMLTELRRNTILWLLALATLITGGLLMGERANAEATQGLHLSGQGEIAVVPDLARLTLQISEEGQDAVALKDAVDRVTAGVLELADDLGIASKDVVAASMNIYPSSRRRKDGERESFVSVSRTIQLTVRRLERLPEVVNRSLRLGINGVNGIQLDTSRRTELEREALQLAIADARAEAERVAAGFAVTLGPVLTVHVDSHSVEPRLMATREMAMDAGASFAPGEMTIRRNVRAQFAIVAE